MSLASSGGLAVTVTGPAAVWFPVGWMLSVALSWGCWTSAQPVRIRNNAPNIRVRIDVLRGSRRLDPAARPRITRSEPLSRPIQRSRRQERLRRPGGGSGAGRGDAYGGRARPAFLARVFFAPGRHGRPDRLRGRPDPRRPQLHCPERAGHPARPAHPLDDRLVPG